MRNYIPEFIQQNFEARSGSLKAGTLFLDMSGFTAMTETLMASGPTGAEVLSEIINTTFEPVIDLVYSFGGFISTFAGDAFTAIFPTNSIGPLAAAARIRQVFVEHGVHHTRLGTFELKVKQGLSYGEVQWGIIGETTSAYYIAGPAVLQAAMSEHHAQAGHIILDEASYAVTKEMVTVSGEGQGYYSVQQLNTEAAPSAPPARSGNKAIIEKFIPLDKIDVIGQGEFRNIVAAFIRFPEPVDQSSWQSSVEPILNSCQDYGGYFNLLDYGDKGANILVLFGAPVSYEDNSRRAAGFARDVVTAMPQAQIGVNNGRAYAGFVGSTRRTHYTALGDVVNVAARLMMAAQPGQILLPKTLAETLTRFEFTTREDMTFKGKSQATGIAQLTGEGQGIREGLHAGQLIGRVDELARTVQALGPLKENRHSGLTIVAGPAGIGKSKLIHDAVQNLEAEATIQVLQADGILRKGLNPFTGYLAAYFEYSRSANRETNLQSFSAKLDSLLNQSRSLGDERANQLAGELERTSSLLAGLMGLTIPGSLYESLDAKARFENTVYAIRAMVLLQSLQRPLLLVFEDAQGLDQDSKTVLKSLLHDSNPYPFGIVMNIRLGDAGNVPSWVASLTGKRTTIVLEPLARDHGATYLANLLGAPVSDALLHFIQSKTPFNPYFLEQFSSYLLDNGLIEDKGQGYELIAADVEVPNEISNILVARIDRLPVGVKEIFQQAVVLGTEFDSQVLGRLAPNVDVETPLAEGVRLNLWVRGSEGVYNFRQNLLREAGYNMQLESRRKEIHNAAALVLEEYYRTEDSRLADIAFHFHWAANDNKAPEYLERAGDFARDNYRNDKALEFYGLLKHYSLGDVTQAKVLAKQSSVMEVTGNWEAAIALLEQARGLLGHESSPDEQKLLQTLEIRSGELYQKRGEYDLATSILEHAAQEARSAANWPAAADAELSLGRTFWSRGDYGRAEACLTKAQEIYEQQHNPLGAAKARYYTGVVLRDQGAYERAEQLYEKSLKAFEELEDQRWITYPLYDLAVLYQYKGELEKSEQYFRKTQEIYEQIGYKSGTAATLLNLGVIERARGHYEHALEFLNRSLSVSGEINERMAVGYCLFSIAAVLYKKQEYDTALSHFKTAYVELKDIGARGYHGYVLSYTACNLAKMGRYAKALQAARYNLENIDEIGSDVENGRVYIALGLVFSNVPPDRFTGYGAELRDWIFTKTGLSTAEDFFERAVNIAQEADYVPTLIPALYTYARHLNSKGAAGQAEQLFERALQAARTSGMQGEIDYIQSMGHSLAPA